MRDPDSAPGTATTRDPEVAASLAQLVAQSDLQSAHPSRQPSWSDATRQSGMGHDCTPVEGSAWMSSHSSQRAGSTSGVLSQQADTPEAKAQRTRYSLYTTHASLTTHYASLTTHSSTHHSLLIPHYSFLTIRCLPPTTHCSPPVSRSSLLAGRTSSGRLASRLVVSHRTDSVAGRGR